MAKVYNVNVSMTYGGSSHIYNIKETLKSAGWVVSASSDGSTYFNGSDGITTDAPGAGGMDNDNAWYFVVDPDDKHAFVFQRGAGAFGQRNWFAYMLHDYSQVSGSIPTTVTASVVSPPIWGATQNNFAGYFIGSGSQLCDLFFDPTESHSQRSHVVAYDTPYNGTYGFYSFCSENGTTVGRTNSTIVLDPLLSGSVPVTNPAQYVIKATYLSGTSLSYTTAGLNNSFNNVHTMYIPYRNTTAAYKTYGYTIIPVDYGTPSYTITYPGMPYAFSYSSYTISIFSTNISDPINYYDGEVPLLIYPWVGVTNPHANYYKKYLGLPGRIRQTHYHAYYNGSSLSSPGVCFPDTINLATDAYIVVALGWCYPWPENVVPLI